MSKNKVTSNKIASLASQVLTSNSSSNIAKKLAGSALSQKNTQKNTSTEMETIASKVLQSQKYSEETQTLAASVLSQSIKNR